MTVWATSKSLREGRSAGHAAGFPISPGLTTGRTGTTLTLSIRPPRPGGSPNQRRDTSAMQGTSSSTPIFIVGVPRSGTTLLAAILGAHPRIVCGHETHFFSSSFSEGLARAICRDPRWPSRAIDYLHAIPVAQEAVRPIHGFSRDELTAALAARRPSIPSVLSGMMKLFVQRHGARRWCEKTPDHLPYVARIRSYYPDSPIIRIVRDPRAVAASMRNVPWGPRSLVDSLLLYREYEDASAGFFERDPRAHTIRYEDLRNDPESTARELCRLVGGEFEPAMLDTSKSARLVNPMDHSCEEQGGPTGQCEPGQGMAGDPVRRRVAAYRGDPRPRPQGPQLSWAAVRSGSPGRSLSVSHVAPISGGDRRSAGSRRPVLEGSWRRLAPWPDPRVSQRVTPGRFADTESPVDREAGGAPGPAPGRGSSDRLVPGRGSRAVRRAHTESARAATAASRESWRDPAIPLSRREVQGAS